jgi:hypothetical protein
MSDRRFPVGSRRSRRLFRHRQERPVFRSIAPLMFEETMVPVARLGAVIRRSALRALASAVEHLKCEYGELQQLREAVAEAERTYLIRQQSPQARPLSENPPDACLSLAPPQAAAAASPGQPTSPKVEPDYETSEARADRDALPANLKSHQSASVGRSVSFPTEPFPSIFLKTRER